MTPDTKQSPAEVAAQRILHELQKAPLAQRTTSYGEVITEMMGFINEALTEERKQFHAMAAYIAYYQVKDWKRLTRMGIAIETEDGWKLTPEIIDAAKRHEKEKG